MEKGLKDRHGRTISYLRLAVTDRCNLRCVYCRPDGQEPFRPATDLLALDELERLVRIFAGLGVTKVRITGGEPFMREDLLPFLARLKNIDSPLRLAITSNGTRTGPHLNELRKLGISSLNLSLDTLSADRFRRITGGNYLHDVLDTIETATGLGITIKINTVIIEEINADELLGLVSLAEKHPVEVRFIERMCFNGRRGKAPAPTWNVDRLQELLAGALPEMLPVLHRRGASARVFKVRGFQGTIGLIGGYSRIFCDTCNKVRVTPYGLLKNCLYDDGVLDLRGLLRSGANDHAIAAAIVKTVLDKPADGFVAEKQRNRDHGESMSCIGG